MPDEQMNQDIQQDLSEQARIRRAKLQKLKDEGADPFEATSYPFTHLSNELTEGFDALEGQTVAIAGRMMSRRIMGKASFAHIQDANGRLQVYMKLDELGEKPYSFFKELDIGDIVGVTGELFRTSRGEISIKAASFELLTKALLPLPEKYHGLKDQELRYRQRYLDLMLNAEVKDTFITRSRVIQGIRHFLDRRGFLEVETPVLHIIDTGAEARPFHTRHNTLDLPMFMRIELELYLKRLVVGGIDRVYEIGRIFRNEGMSVKHNPEFTMCELYQAYTDYNGMMELVEELYSTLALEIKGSMKFTYQGVELDFSPPWERLTMAEALKKYGDEDYYAWEDDAQARQAAKRHHVELPEGATKGDALAALFDALVEDKLIQPVFITDYPVEISPLAKRRRDNPLLTERFEFFIYGREGGNAFSELNDPIDQRARFERQVAARVKQGHNSQVDDDFVNALEYGLPPTGGLGFGVDRLVMLLTDSYSIRDVILFPTMKPLA